MADEDIDSVSFTMADEDIDGLPHAPAGDIARNCSAEFGLGFSATGERGRRTEEENEADGSGDGNIRQSNFLLLMA
jgi:hypothetical protein